MLRGAIALVFGKAILRVARVQLHHIAVPLDFCHDGRRGDAVALRVAMDDGFDCARQVEPRHGVDEKNRARQAARRFFHSAARGVQDVERVNLPRPHPGGARV